MASDAHIRTRCTNPKCRREYRVLAGLSGQPATCKLCSTRFVITAVIEAEGRGSAAPPQPSSQVTQSEDPTTGSNSVAPNHVKRILTITFSSVGVVLIGLASWVYVTTRPQTLPEQPGVGESKLAVAENSPEPFTPQQQPTQRSFADIVAQVESSVALIHDGLGCGTGFMVEPTILATNAHVVYGMSLEDTTIYFPAAGEATYRILRIMHFDKQRDLCLVEIDGKHKPIQLAGSSTFRRGDDVIVIGNPAVGKELILKNAITKGLVSSEAIVEGQEFLQISASINPGNSGGPIVNRDGKVIAVATLKATEQEGIAFGIPASDVVDALEQLKHTTEEQIAQLNDLYTAKTAFTRLYAYAYANRTVMQAYTELMDLSIQSGQSASDGLKGIQADMEAPLSELATTVRLKSVEASLRRLQKSDHLDSETKKNLLELWGCAQQIQSYVENPRGNFNSGSPVVASAMGTSSPAGFFDAILRPAAALSAAAVRVEALRMKRRRFGTAATVLRGP